MPLSLFGGKLDLKKYALPALSQLHTFEAVSRRMSFTDAADGGCQSPFQGRLWIDRS